MESGFPIKEFMLFSSHMVADAQAVKTNVCPDQHQYSAYYNTDTNFSGILYFHTAKKEQAQSFWPHFFVSYPCLLPCVAGKDACLLPMISFKMTHRAKEQ